jgi:outer membrane murein-binding lipoprotein Lpp
VTGKNKVELTLAGDARDLSSALSRGASDVDGFAKDVARAGDKAVAALKDVDKAAQSIQPAELKINSNMIPAAKKDLKDLENAGQDLKPVKLKAKVDTEEVSEGLRRAGDIGADAFSGSFLGALAGGSLVGGLTEMITSGLDAISEQKNLAIDLQNTMGVSPEDAAQYGQRIGKAYADGIGTSKADIAEVYSTLSSDVHDWAKLSTDAQDKVARNQVKINDAFKKGSEETISAVSSAVDNKLVPSWQAGQDLLVKGFQTLGARGSDWAETLKEYSGYFTQLGIQGPEALGLISQALQAGARDTDFAADVWKEVGIRIIDTASTTRDALKDLFKGTKTNIEDLQRTIAAGGPPAEAALEKVITKLQGIKDPVERNRQGVALFGTQYEDTFRRVIEKTDFAKAKLEDYSGATDKLVAHQRTLTEELGQIWDKINLEIGTAINNASEDMGKGPEGLIKSFEDADVKVSGALRNIGVSIDGTNRAISDLAATVGGPTTEQFGKLINSMTNAELAALGVSVKLDEMGRKILTLPSGNVVIVDNANQVTGDINALEKRARDLSGKTFFLNLVQRITTQGNPNANLPLPFGGYAAGGRVIAPGTTTSDTGIARVSNREFVEPADVAGRWEPQLERLRHGASWQDAGGMGPQVVRVPVRDSRPPRLVLAGNADSRVGAFLNGLISRGIIRVN